MKFVKLLLNNIFIPLCTILFILTGIFAALFSAIIEYSVLKELFKSKYQHFIPASIIAIALVLILEYGKFYLHYLSGRAKDSDNAYAKTAKKIVFIPIAISFLCTVIFSVTTLDKASYDEDALQTQIEQINNDAQKEIQQQEAAFDTEHNERLAAYRETMNNANSALANYDSNNMNYRNSRTKVEALQAQANAATQDYKDADSALYEEYNTKKENSKKEILDRSNKKIAAAKAAHTDDQTSIYDNKVLSHFLQVIWSVIFKHSTYPRAVYLLICVFAGLLISAFIEIIISYSSHFMGTSFDSLVDTVDVPSEKLRNWCNQCILLYIKTVCALVLYLFCMVAASEKIELKNFLLGIIACFIAIYIMQNNSTTLFDTNSSSDSNNNISTVDTYIVIRDSLLQGSLALIGYILLGLLFGQDAITLGWPTFAIGFGAALSSCISELPKKIFS